MTLVAPRIVNSVSCVTRINSISCVKRIDHEGYFAWQAQYLVKLKCHFSWQAVVGAKSNLGCEAGCG